MEAQKEKIKAFIVENFLFGEDNGLKDETSFLDEGIIDSTGILELVDFLEQEFNIAVEDEELTPENLDTITNVDNFISRKLAA
jgi:acyl carrier protein